MTTTKEPVATYDNAEDGMRAYVWVSDRGGYNVTVQDLDSGLFVPMAIVGIADVEVAKAKARKAVGV